MKKILLTMIIASTSLASTSFAREESANTSARASANTYVSTCRNETPLTTYERCAANFNSAYWAYSCAEQEALAQCKEAYNADCVVVGSTYSSIISREFIGYKACEVTVTVHGYRLN